MAPSLAHILARHFRPGARAAAVLLMACLVGLTARAVFGQSPSPGRANGAAVEAPHQVYLPLLAGSRAPASSPTPTPGPSPTPGPGPSQSGFFVEPERKTGTAATAIDAQGGSHMAYRYYVPAAEHPQVVYAYCPPPASQCGDGARWGRVALYDGVEEVQLELTPAGTPRLLVLIGASQGQDAFFAYAECDANCLTTDGWNAIGVQTKRDVVGTVPNPYTPRRSFELDPAGRPRFVYYDANYAADPDHAGGFYLWCDAACTTEGSWNEVRFTQELPGQFETKRESLSEPVLKFTRDGRPRILAQLNPIRDENAELRFDLYYIGCDGGCESPDSWRRVPLIERGSGFEPAWDLELDPATDNPRAVNYQSGQRKLFYHWCDGDCFSPGGWQTLLLRADGWGMGADLKLDGQGRPRLAVLNTARGLGLLECDRGCGQGASWRERLVETLADLDRAYPIARPVTCNNGLWYVYAPSVAFDGAGNVSVIYDAAYQAKCQYVDPTQPAPPTDVFHEIWHAVRFVAVR
jgi:hypothetical protein